jgi:glutathione S-transferase
MYTFDEQIVSDLHKDARGYRPDAYFWEEWNQCGDHTRQAMWDNLLVELEREIERERAAEEAALEQFEQLIADTVQFGAADAETAIRWILEGEDFTGVDLAYGADYVAWHFGMSYSNPYRTQIQTVIDQISG